MLVNKSNGIRTYCCLVKKTESLLRKFGYKGIEYPCNRTK